MMNPQRFPLGYLALLALLLIAPALVYPVLIMKVLCFAVFACAFNLLLGYTGLLSFGHAAFLGGAAYLTAHALKVWALPTLAGLALGTLGAAALGWVMGSLAIRRQGIYFAMSTLALAQLVFFLLLKSEFTGGEDGLQGVPRGSVLGFDLSSDTHLYYLVLAVAAGAFWLIHRTIHSPFGQILKAIRENEARAVSLGYDVDRYKLLAFVLSAAVSGLAGALKTLVFSFATLSDAHWHTSGEVVLMTLLGGVGTVFGPVAGAAVIVTLQNELADKVGSLVTVIMGFIFAACVLAFRRGLVGEAIALFRRMIGEKVQ
ncbi:branched-chain amino acid ABC transporter permease [Zoogloea sp.]|uniref:branched-chain amino acid ABC transporter permease n=1 Tax=Zoogloea sp. TaxID=49181 RepID=UPI0025F4A3AF|nr:branched-chain amino acid ABC transporter permease [Zoogloea sp.]MCK6375883.1 branched-chain amino acid ABC transporter permease [Zoogloea sp.]MCK6396402.1 branched-chain amino acid ABC transporter permease [Zoogloea sp.]